MEEVVDHVHCRRHDGRDAEKQGGYQCAGDGVERNDLKHCLKECFSMVYSEKKKTSLRRNEFELKKYNN